MLTCITSYFNKLVEMKRKLDQHILDEMHKNLSNWHGPFYSNSKDPRFIVPKYNPILGWTLNFANPYVYMAVSLAIVAFVFYSIIM